MQTSEGWDGGDTLNGVDLLDGYLMTFERLMLQALESIDKTEFAKAVVAYEDDLDRN